MDKLIGLAFVSVVSVIKFGWLDGAALATGIYLLMPYIPRFRTE